MKNLFCFIIGLVLILGTNLLFSQSDINNDLFEGRKEIFIAIPIQNNNININTLSHTIYIDRITTDTIYAYVTINQYESFNNLNLNFIKLTPPSMRLSDAELNMKDESDILTKQITSWDYYPTYSAYLTLMQQFAQNYPDLCKLDTIGTTVEGRLILSAIISDNVQSNEKEPKIFYTSSMHGDELTGYVLMLHLIDYLLQNYNSNTRIQKIVDSLEIHINPLANPDGTYASGNNTVSGATRVNANGMDINRNFPVPNGSIGEDNTYSIETETQAFMDYGNEYPFVMAMNFHGGAEIANYPWDYKTADHPDKTWWIYICKEYADTAQYYSPSGYFEYQPSGADYPGVIEGASWYVVSGSRQDWMNYFTHCREITLEISNTKTPAASELVNFWTYNYHSFLNYLEQAIYGIRGTVIDGCTGNPMKALITIYNHDADSSQVYSHLPHGDYYRPIAAGTWTMIVSAPGYQSDTITNITIQNKSITVSNVTLYPYPPVADFTADVTNTCTGIVNFINNSTTSVNSSFLWDFGDGTTSNESNPTHFYTQNGTYSVKLKVTSCAGEDSVIYNNFITVEMPDSPSFSQTNYNICYGEGITIQATANGDIYWYSDTVGNSIISTGNQYYLSNIINDDTIYVNNTISSTYYGGKTDNSGTGSYYNYNLEHGLYFNCLQSVNLKSVKVYANSTADRTIKLYDSNSNQIYSQTINIPSGESRINLNWQIPIGNNMKITASAFPNLYRNGTNGGPNLGYPFNINNFITITSSTAGNNPTSYYYYFYDWEIEEKCESPLIPIYINVIDLPTAEFSYEINGNNVIFSNLSQNADSSYWDFGDGNYSYDTDPTHTYNNGSSFIVRLIVTNDCGSDTMTETINITNINDLDEEKITFVNIDNNLIIHSQNLITNIQITNILGQTFYDKDVNDNICEISMQTWKAGIYLIKINNKKFYKFIKF
ncbi:MAG: M14 family zinc carboxypeptidase [Bacteroidales bacterium]|jgi:PKD repeat protein|nr:M14 family zinc carboxypeptidase [Bacteroidales bacterium]